MNTSENNIEYQIKKQIDEREITPSRDLWSEIEVKTQTENISKTKKVNWFLVAACLVLTLSLGAVLFFDQDSKPNVLVAETNSTKVLKENSIKTVVPNSSEVIQQNQEKFNKVENLASTKSEIKPSEVIVEAKELPIIKENPKEIAAQISQIPAEKILAKTDSTKTQVKKKRYVDPSTLLFSVEHKDVIEKTKGGSNVATIDLNSK
ncbi:hypothetical protein PGH12_11950 [Chryseobacterium wangxinyae]|uniref:hypothetical protein n=1 Tax=Chryseobacterium sp. CY350 TaxID=2997336 RepID=UPI00226D9429|nr:hypothetical protein [Chryseobacterium sp. CY350]MCY0976216.1 hypothetical protein [Chryseobacterium sp. CY350]WBZ94186.1 hypothetical protein PGH12_11950 [Chryseobacterium sp. CY350]